LSYSNRAESAYVDLRKICHEDHKALRRRLALILKEPSDIDDVIQDAYVRIMEIKSSGSKIDNPPAFMHRVCVNLALDRTRQLQRRERLFVSDNFDEVTSMIENQPSRELTPEEYCAREELGKDVMSALQELPEKCRNAFVLKRFWDFNYREIASDINLSVSMIEKHVKRASTCLQKSFADTVY
jgi:RNA polymerase sigma factor (sigma-70 family)